MFMLTEAVLRKHLFHILGPNGHNAEGGCLCRRGVFMQKGIRQFLCANKPRLVACLVCLAQWLQLRPSVGCVDVRVERILFRLHPADGQTEFPLKARLCWCSFEGLVSKGNPRNMLPFCSSGIRAISDVSC